jgi:hypothetical protein
MKKIQPDPVVFDYKIIAKLRVNLPPDHSFCC